MTTKIASSTAEDAELDSIFSVEGKHSKAVKPGKGAQVATPRLDTNILKGGSYMKRIQSSTCPTCGAQHPSGTVQTYEVPEYPVVDAGLLKGVQEEIAKLGEGVVKIAMPDISPLTQFAKVGQDAFKRIQDALAGHPKPNEDLIKLWEGCPECKVLYDKMKGNVEQEALKKVVNPHPVTVEHFKECPECQKVLAALVPPDVSGGKPPRYWWEGKK